MPYAPAPPAAAAGLPQVILADGRNAAKGGGGGRQVSIGAFVMPNAPIDARIPLTAFAVPLEPLEQVAGRSRQAGLWGSSAKGDFRSHRRRRHRRQRNRALRTILHHWIQEMDDDI